MLMDFLITKKFPYGLVHSYLIPIMITLMMALRSITARILFQEIQTVMDWVITMKFMFT